MIRINFEWRGFLIWFGREEFLSISNLLSVCTLYTSFSVDSVFCLAYFCLIIIETSFPYEHHACLKQTNNVTDPLYLSFWDLVNNKVVSNDLNPRRNTILAKAFLYGNIG